MAQVLKLVPSQVGDYIVVYFLDEQPAGKQFIKKRDDWPLHLTLLSWFQVDSEDELAETLELVALYNQKLHLTLGKDVAFSPDTTVSVVADQRGVTMLHGALFATIEDLGAKFRSTEWAGENYTAHVTHHRTSPIPRAGDELSVDQFSLIKLLPDSVCEIVQQFGLGASR